MMWTSFRVKQVSFPQPKQPKQLRCPLCGNCDSAPPSDTYLLLRPELKDILWYFVTLEDKDGFLILILSLSPGLLVYVSCDFWYIFSLVCCILWLRPSVRHISASPSRTLWYLLTLEYSILIFSSVPCLLYWVYFLLCLAYFLTLVYFVTSTMRRFWPKVQLLSGNQSSHFIVTSIFSEHMSNMSKNAIFFGF